MTNAPLILLAAGKSSRMGTPKGLILLKNKTLLEIQIESFLSAGGKNIIIVLGSDFPEYKKSLPWIENGSIKILINPTPDLGQFLSLQIACQELLLNLNFTAGFILPIDVPIMKVSLWEKMFTTMDPHKTVSLPTYNSKGGHPILISREFIEELIAVDVHLPSARLDIQINLLDKNEILRVEIDDECILYNINTPEDLKKITNS